MTNRKVVFPLVILSLVFLFNPNANLIDVMPDFVAYVLFILVIGSLSESVPYLAECKGALIKLALVTLIKIPAFLVMYSNMVSGKDIVPLFTLVFAVLELILLYSAVENGFRALGYIGERTDCASVRDPFSVGRGRMMTPESLKILTYIFFVARATFNVIPELLLLTPEDTSLRRKLQEAYPAILVISILASLAIGIIWLSRTVKYVKAIRHGEDLGAAINTLAAKGSPEEIGAKERIKRLASALIILAFSSLFIFDVTFSDLGGYNRLPHFIYGILLFSSVYSFTSDKRTRLCLIIGTAGFSLSSLLTYLLTVRFFEKYTYLSLAYPGPAKDAYLPVKALAVTETVFALIMLTAAAMATVSFIKEHTDVAPSDPSYSKTNEKNHRTTARKTLPLFIIAGVITIAKCANVFIKETSTLIYSEVNSEGIAASAFPAMDTIIFFTCIVYVIYSFVTVSNLKDEVRFKYGKE